MIPESGFEQDIVIVIWQVLDLHCEISTSESRFFNFSIFLSLKSGMDLKQDPYEIGHKQVEDNNDDADRRLIHSHGLWLLAVCSYEIGLVLPASRVSNG